MREKMRKALAVVASAILAGVGTANTDVVTGLTGIKDDALATMTSVAPIALGIFAVFLGWKYGKQIFNSLGKKN